MMKSRKARVEAVLRSCGCVCFCPVCDEPLNDQATVKKEDNGDYTYTCVCGAKSRWDFDAAPVPILVGVHYALKEEVT